MVRVENGTEITVKKFVTNDVAILCVQARQEPGEITQAR